MNLAKIPLQISLLVCSLVALSQEQEQWRWVAPYPPRLQAYSATVVENRAYFWCSENLVLATTDGGQSFTVTQYAPTRDVALGCCNGHGIAFADSLTGIITDIAYGQFRTTNGGRTWTQVGNPSTGFEMVEFGSSTVGWKVGEGGTQRTTNAGNSWSPVGQLYSTGGIFSNIYALDENRLWVMKSYYGGRPPEGSIWYSQNSGSTWTRANTGLTSDTATQITYNAMRVNSSGVGFAAGSIYRLSTQTREAFVLKTTDLGTSWTYTGLPNEGWEEVVSVSDSVWILFGNSGSYPNTQPIHRRTTDMGQTWLLSTPFATVNYNILYSAVYLAVSNTIVVTTLQGIYKSSDGGQTYTRLTSERDIIVTDVILEKRPPSSSEQMVIAKTTYSRYYLLSTDGGTLWRRQEIPPSVGSEIWATRIVDGQIFIITNQIQLYRSTDIGASWNQISVPAQGALRALDVYDRNFLALQGFPNIVSSSDAGVTWSRGPFPGTMWLNEAAIVYPGTLVAVGGFYDSTGTRGIIYHTTDNGLSWRIEDTPTEMAQISMVSENVGFAMGTNRLYKTTNSGKSWFISRSATSYYSFQAFCFENLTYGILRDAYFTFETLNGGVSWQQIDLGIPVQYPVYRMAYNASGELLVAGNGRLVIRSAGRNASIENPANKEMTQPILYQNNPNPFNPSTTISFNIPEAGWVDVVVYDVLGRRTETLLSKLLGRGSYSIQFDGGKLASGIYFCQLRTQIAVLTKKMILIR
jgi:photosystem II stability/assembly factor-like uncharacterized protein